MATSGLMISEFDGVMIVGFRSVSITEMPVIETIGKELYALIEGQAKTKVLLDFSAVRHLSSQMLGVLVALQKKAAQIKGRVIICSMRPDLMKVFTITKLDKILEFAPDAREAAHRLNSRT